MMTFARFLAEKFYKGAQGRHGYVEVYLNPSPSEMSEVSHGDEYTQLGAWVVGKNLYVWDRDGAEHGETKHLCKASDSSLPLYLYYNRKNKNLAVDVSSFSMFQSGNAVYDGKKIRDICRIHPAFKGFNIMSYDEYL